MDPSFSASKEKFKQQAPEKHKNEMMDIDPSLWNLEYETEYPLNSVSSKQEKSLNKQHLKI